MIHFLAGRKILPARFISNSLEFEGIKTGVVDAFPDAEEQNGVLVLAGGEAEEEGGSFVADLMARPRSRRWRCWWWRNRSIWGGS